MRHTTLLRALALCGCLAALVVANRLGSVSRADSPLLAGQTAGTAAGRSPTYQGPGDCVICHDGGNANRARYGNDSDKYFQLTELATWEKSDKHALAGEVLKNSRSETMLKLLKQSDPKASIDDCLSCHAVNVAPSAVAGENRDLLVKLQAEGVSCEVCHGRASAWVDDHWHVEKWRNNKNMTPEAKSAKGFIDLRDDVTRAKVCLSCHLGNPKDEPIAAGVTLPRRVVTHEMFAAGHPPISGFEIETFAKAMPYHWTGKMPPQYAPYYGAERLGPMRSARAMTVAALVALQQYARLVGGDDAGRPALDLASYDCAACHHELTTASWRQARGYGGRSPGRPAARSWPVALGVIAVAACGEQGKPLAGAIENFRDAIAAKPFGDSHGIADAAAKLDGAIAAAIAGLGKQPFDERKGLDIMRAIAENGSQRPCDFETARQLAWCLRTVYDDMPQGKQDAKVKEIIDAMAGKEELALDLPTRAEECPGAPAERVAGTDPAAGRSCVVNRSVPQALAAAAKYDVAPSRFQDRCQKLVELLKPPLK